jgi:5-methylthioadenosine/S-adenosylhomocysteine deaminase
MLLLLLCTPFIAPTAKKDIQKTVSKSAKKTTIDLLVHNGTLITMNKQREMLNHGAVAITNGRIVDVGIIAEKYRAKQTIDAKNAIIMPGLINGHTHAPMVLLRGIADDLATKDWLKYYIFPIEAKQVNKDFVYWGTQLACLEMIQGGTTTFVDMYYFEDTIAQAASDIGMRIIAGQTTMDNSTPDSKTAENSLALAVSLAKKWKNSELVSPAIAPHAPYTVSGATLQKANQISKEYNIPFIIHLSETKAEKDTGATYLESLGVLSNQVIAAHVVHPTASDITALQRHGVGVIHCPLSNMKLSSGISPVTRMLKEGVLIGLGTDGAASNNSLDMFGEMKTASLLQKVAGVPTDLSALQVLEMATINGARAIHKEHEIGSIEKGKRADILLVNIDAIHQVPVYNVISQLVYATKSSDVQTVIVNGKILMHDRIFAKSISEKAIRKHVKKIQQHIQKTVSKKTASTSIR